jgi:transposase
MTYDKHMRARVLHHVDNYLGPGGFAGACDAAGKHYQVGATTARTWYEERETTGNVAPKRKRDGTSNIEMLEAHAVFLCDHLRYVDCQLYVSEMAKLVSDQFGVGVKYTARQIEAMLKRN